jgi:YD repeat-containing protein
MAYLTMGLDEDSESGRVTIHEENGASIAFDPDPESPGDYIAATPRCISILEDNGDGTWTFTRSNSSTVFHFNEDGQVAEITPALGDPDDGLVLDYDDDELDTVTDAAGRTLTFDWDSGRIRTVTDDTDREVQFTYDGSGDLTSWTDVGGGTWEFRLFCSIRGSCPAG